MYTENFLSETPVYSIANVWKKKKSIYHCTEGSEFDKYKYNNNNFLFQPGTFDFNKVWRISWKKKYTLKYMGNHFRDQDNANNYKCHIYVYVYIYT